MKPILSTFYKAIKMIFVFFFLLVSGQLLLAQSFINFGTISSGNQALCDPANPAIITFSVAPSGASTFTYNWFYKDGIVAAPTGSNPGDWNIISGATSGFYDPPAGLSKSRTYACFVSGPNAIRNWATGARQIRVYHNGEITTSYQAFTQSGDPFSVSFSSLPSGPTGLTFSYQWYFKNGVNPAPTGTSTSGWTIISGATGTSYDPPAGLNTSRSYACFVSPSNSLSCLTSRWTKGVKQVMVYPFLNGTITTSQNLYCAPADPLPITFSVLPSIGSTFQWYFQNGINLFETGLEMEASTNGWTLISGATTMNYDPPAGLTTSRTYACRVSNSGFSLWTNAIGIKVSTTVTGVISSQQTGCTQFNPAPIVFSTAPVGSDYYLLHWYYVENPNFTCQTSASFNPLDWTSAAIGGPTAANFMTSQIHDPTTSGPNGRTYILRLSPSVTPSCETPYVTNCHRIFVNPCRESVDENPVDEINTSETSFLGDIFPNPASTLSTLEIRLPSDPSKGIFSIRSLDGKSVYDQLVSQEQSQMLKIDLSRFQSGMYFYTLEVKGMPTMVKKLVVQKQ